MESLWKMKMIRIREVRSLPLLQHAVIIVFARLCQKATTFGEAFNYPHLFLHAVDGVVDPVHPERKGLYQKVEVSLYMVE